MSRIAVVTIAFLLLSVPFMQARAAEPVELMHAFDAGDVSLKLTALEEGKSVDVTVTNLSEAAVTVVIQKGRTAVEVYDRKVFLVCAEAKKLAIAKGASAKVTLPMEQQGAGAWTGGSVTMSRPKPGK